MLLPTPVPFTEAISMLFWLAKRRTRWGDVAGLVVRFRGWSGWSGRSFCLSWSRSSSWCFFLCRSSSWCFFLCRSSSWCFFLCRSSSWCFFLCRSSSRCLFLCRSSWGSSWCFFLGWRCVSGTDYSKNGANFSGLVFWNADFQQGTSNWGRNFGVNLVGRNLKQWLVDGNFFANFLQPTG